MASIWPALVAEATVLIAVAGTATAVVRARLRRNPKSVLQSSETVAPVALVAAE